MIIFFTCAANGFFSKDYSSVKEFMNRQYPPWPHRYDSSELLLKEVECKKKIKQHPERTWLVTTFEKGRTAIPLSENFNCNQLSRLDRYAKRFAKIRTPWKTLNSVLTELKKHNLEYVDPVSAKENNGFLHTCRWYSEQNAI